MTRTKGLTPAALRKELYKVAREEVKEWNPGTRGVALAVLFCFVHRFLTGERIEQSFPSKTPSEIDYQI